MKLYDEVPKGPQMGPLNQTPEATVCVQELGASGKVQGGTRR